MDKIKISGTGCALIDYLYLNIDFNAPFFLKYQSKMGGDGGLYPGRLVFTEHLEEFAAVPYHKILSEITNGVLPTTFNLGGPGLVSMIHVAQMLNSDQFEVGFFAGLGNDDKANVILDLIQKTPLNIENYIKVSDKPTPFTDVFSDPNYDNGHGERTFINNIGAAWDYEPRNLNNNFFDSDIVCFGGTALVPTLHDELSSLLHKAKQKNCISVVNTVFDFRNEMKNPKQRWPIGNGPQDLKLIDLLIMDKEEALRISGTSSIDDAASYFIKHQTPSFIITNGAQNITAYADEGIFNKTELAEYPVSAAVKQQLSKPETIKGDTTGCGDNFVGGVVASVGNELLTKKRGQLNFEEAIAWGVASGGVACFYEGGTFFENETGEKAKWVQNYINDYLHQIRK